MYVYMNEKCSIGKTNLLVWKCLKTSKFEHLVLCTTWSFKEQRIKLQAMVILQRIRNLYQTGKSCATHFSLNASHVKRLKVNVNSILSVIKDIWVDVGNDQLFAMNIFIKIL